MSCPAAFARGCFGIRQHHLKLAVQRSLVKTHRLSAAAIEEQVGIELTRGNPYHVIVEWETLESTVM